MHRILLIDDNGGIRAILRSYLEGSGFEVTTAKDGEEGIQVFGDGQSFDVVVTDIRMPRKDGYEVARHFKGSSKKRYAGNSGYRVLHRQMGRGHF